MTPDAHVRALLARIQATETAAREAMRAARFALDDLATAHETLRQLRAELAAVLGGDDTSGGGDTSVPAHALVVEHGPCGQPVVSR